MTLRQGITGQIVGRGALNRSADMPNTAAKSRGNVATALILNPTIAAFGDMLVQSPRATLTAGFMYSPEIQGAGNFNVAEGNMTAVAADPAVENWDIYALRMTGAQGADDETPIRAVGSGPITAQIITQTIDHPNIPTLTVVEAPTTAIAAFAGIPAPQVGDPVLVSPRAALPAGLGLSHARVSAPGIIQIGLANPTGGGIDPAGIEWDICYFPAIGTRSTRAAPYGRPARPFDLTVDLPNIPAQSTVEVAATLERRAEIGDPVFVSGPTDLNIGLCVSHARLSDVNTVQIGITNITAGAIDDGVRTFLGTTIPRRPIPN